MNLDLAIPLSDTEEDSEEKVAVPTMVEDGTDEELLEDDIEGLQLQDGAPNHPISK